MLIPELAVNPLGTHIIEAFFADECVHCLLGNIGVYVIVCVCVCAGGTQQQRWRR